MEERKRGQGGTVGCYTPPFPFTPPTIVSASSVVSPKLPLPRCTEWSSSSSNSTLLHRPLVRRPLRFSLSTLTRSPFTFSLRLCLPSCTLSLSLFRSSLFFSHFLRLSFDFIYPACIEDRLRRYLNTKVSTMQRRGLRCSFNVASGCLGVVTPRRRSSRIYTPTF